MAVLHSDNVGTNSFVSCEFRWDRYDSSIATGLLHSTAGINFDFVDHHCHDLGNNIE